MTAGGSDGRAHRNSSDPARELALAARGNDIVLRARGKVDGDAATHLLEMARLALSARCSSVTIDLAGVHASTPTADKLLYAPGVREFLGRVTVRVGSQRSGHGDADASPAA